MKLNPTIADAADALRNEQLVAIPTETVYGLAGNAFSDIAVELIYTTKNRPPINPLIVHIAGKEKIHEVAKNIPNEALKLADLFWPGPLTLVLEKQEIISSLVTAGKNTVGVRVPDHPITLQLLASINFPLVAPSANRSNHISPTKPEHVSKSLGKNAPLILDGGTCSTGIESTIVGFVNNDVVLYRHGAISKEQIEKELKRTIKEVNNELSPESPGMFKKHYSPKTPLLNFKELQLNDNQYKGILLGVITFQEPIKTSKKIIQKVLSPSGKLQEYAANLYATLYEMDEMNLDLILIQEVPDTGIGSAINDRIKRAADDSVLI